MFNGTDAIFMYTI